MLLSALVFSAALTAQSWDVGAMVAGQSADVVTTCRALGSGRFVESNGLLPGSCAGIASVKAVSTVGAAFVVRALRKRGHKTTARVVAISWALAGGAAAIYNARRMSR